MRTDAFRIKEEPTRPWVAGEGTVRGDFGEGMNWGVIPVLGSNGAIVCDVVVRDPGAPTAEERARLDAILATGR